MGADPAVRVSVPIEWAEVTGATLMDLLGPYQEVEEAGHSHLVFYPFRHGPGYVSDEELLAILPADDALRSRVVIERVLVPEGWEEGWKDHFRPLTVGRVYVRPPWEEPPPDVGAGDAPAAATSPDGAGGVPATGPLLDVVLTPGLAFGTGLHPTTRGVLALLQDDALEGPLTDAGTGSGILSIAAALLGFRPVRAFDNDPLAVEAARTNAVSNGVEVDVRLCDVTAAPLNWLAGTTVLANLTLEPVRELLGLLPQADAPVRRLLAAGILAGDQEAEVLERAAAAGLRPARLIYEGEWVSLDLRPAGGC
jgi:ribosomal protein L11 methyltransferase